MSQTVVLEQQQQTAVTPETITLKFDDCASTSNPTPTSEPENQPTTVKAEDSEPNANVIPIPDSVGPQIQEVVEEFLRRNGSSDEEVRTAARNDLRSFIEREEIAIPTLLVLAKYAHDAKYTDLLDVVCQRVADLIKDKKVEEIREIFNITNDFTPEEEQAIRDEHAWAFED